MLSRLLLGSIRPPRRSIIDGRTYYIRLQAAYLAGSDLHLERHHWQSNGDIVSRLADDHIIGSLSPDEADEAVKAYDAMLDTFEETRR